MSLAPALKRCQNRCGNTSSLSRDEDHTTKISPARGWSISAGVPPDARSRPGRTPQAGGPLGAGSGSGGGPRVAGHQPGPAGQGGRPSPSASAATTTRSSSWPSSTSEDRRARAASTSPACPRSSPAPRPSRSPADHQRRRRAGHEAPHVRGLPDPRAGRRRAAVQHGRAPGPGGQGGRAATARCSSSGAKALNVSRDGVKVFDTDFGRIAILTCFDANFDEVWQEAERQGRRDRLLAQRLRRRHAAERLRHDPQLLRRGGRPGQHHRPAPARRSRTVGEAPAQPVHRHARPRPHPGPHELQRARRSPSCSQEHQGEVELERIFDMEAWYVLRRPSPGVRVRRPVQAVPDRDRCATTATAAASRSTTPASRAAGFDTNSGRSTTDEPR